MWQEKKFHYGETRVVALDVVRDGGIAIAPDEASWELTEYESGVIESSGDCEIAQVGEGYTLKALVAPAHTGLYRLIFTFALNDEVRKPCMIIKVK